MSTAANIVTVMAGAGAGVFISFLGRQLQSEFADWTRPACHRLIERAVSRLPENTRDRFREEWIAHVNDTPGQVWKWRVAYGYTTAARQISREAQPALAGARGVEVAGRMLAEVVSTFSATGKFWKNIPTLRSMLDTFSMLDSFSGIDSWKMLVEISKNPTHFRVLLISLFVFGVIQGLSMALWYGYPTIERAGKIIHWLLANW